MNRVRLGVSSGGRAGRRLAPHRRTWPRVSVTSDGPSVPIAALSPTCQVTNPPGQAVYLCKMVPSTQCGTAVDATGVLSREREVGGQRSLWAERH